MKLRLASLVLVAVFTIIASAQNQATNADIAKMLKAGVDQNVIKWVIDNSNAASLDASASALQKLKTAGASQAILDAVSAKARSPHPATTVATTAKTKPHTAKLHHGSSIGRSLRSTDSATSSRAEKQAESLQAETCDDTIQTVDDCHANHKTGCSPSQNPRYDAYLNYLKNGLPDPASTASANVNGGSPLGADFFANLESSIPDTLTSTNHAQHSVELAQAGEGQIVTVLGTLYYTIHGGRETCNCELSGTNAVIDFHIGIGFGDFPLGADVITKLRGGADYSKLLSKADQALLDQSAVVVEMTPYYREQFRSGWTLEKVQAATGKQVKVTGQLMIDNVHHKPADDCGLADADTNSCWRASVWEVHPVTTFQVCNADHCDANSTNWINLEDM